jgi:hypothetical protein
MATTPTARSKRRHARPIVAHRRATLANGAGGVDPCRTRGGAPSDPPTLRVAGSEAFEVKLETAVAFEYLEHRHGVRARGSDLRDDVSAGKAVRASS